MSIIVIGWPICITHANLSPFSSFGRIFPDYFVSDGCHQYRHHGRYEIEQAIRKILDCGDLQHRCLGHSAGVPWNKHGDHRCTVLYRTAEQPALVSPVPVQFFVQARCEDNGQILVASYHIGENAGTYCRTYYADTPADIPCEQFGKTLKHSAPNKRPSESDRAENKENRIEHSRHAPCRNKFVQGCIPCIHGSLVIIRKEKALEPLRKRQ